VSIVSLDYHTETQQHGKPSAAHSTPPAVNRHESKEETDVGGSVAAKIATARLDNLQAVTAQIVETAYR
jgi:hypothetical protein